MSENASLKVDFTPTMYIGREIKGVTLIELLGRGAMGAVFVGFQQSLKRKIAVKIFPKINSSLPFLSLRFRDEAETVAVLNHPNIAPVFDMGEIDDLLFLMMQMIEGTNLKEMIRKVQLNPIPSRRIIPPHFALDCMIQILDALEYSHQEGVIHQDIKPANIIIEERSKRPFVVDFGIAHSSIVETDSSKFIMGTPLYMAPEQITETHPDLRSDIYASGMVLFELLAGKLPIHTTKADELMSMKKHNPHSIFTCQPSQVSPLITPDLEQIILKAIAAVPDNRYQSCSDFKHDLESVNVSMK